jgi:MFS family permease
MHTKPTDAAVAEPAAQSVSPYAWYGLVLLTLVYVLNFLDRTLIYILLAPIKAEMKFSDFELALLGSTSFTIFYTLLGIPFGRLADRTVRKNLIAGGLALWSLFSGLTGFGMGFWSIFFCRVMVGVGEATLGPAALSLLSDYFPPRVRATVHAIYSTGIAIGGGIAFFLGSSIGAKYGWRWAFYLLGFPGLLLAVLVFFLREEPRGRTESKQVRYTGRDWKILFRSRPLRYLFLGYALFGLASNNLGFWGPIFVNRLHGFPLLLIGTVGGVLMLTAGVGGTILGSYLSDRLRRTRRGGRMLLSAAAALVSVPLWLGFLFSDSVAVLLVSNFILLGLSLIWLGPAAADVHDIAGPQLRGLGIGIYFFTVNIAAYIIGSPVIGKLNDWVKAAENPSLMRYTLLICPAAAILGALLLWLGSRSLERGE